VLERGDPKLPGGGAGGSAGGDNTDAAGGRSGGGCHGLLRAHDTAAAVFQLEIDERGLIERGAVGVEQCEPQPGQPERQEQESTAGCEGEQHQDCHPHRRDR